MRAPNYKEIAERIAAAETDEEREVVGMQLAMYYRSGRVDDIKARWAWLKEALVNHLERQKS